MYGVLKALINTGLDEELSYGFSTPLSITSNQPAYISDTLSLKRKVNSQKVQRWEVSAEIIPTNDSPNFLTHSVKHGFSEVLYIRMPQVYRNKKQPQVSVTLSNSVGNGGINIPITKASPVNLEGQLINFSGTSKVYLVIKDNGSSIEVFPPLLATITMGAHIIYEDLTILYARYDADTRLGITYSDGILASPGTIKFVEAL
jgi:hypothetical protein